MATQTQSTKLDVTPREKAHSRETRRLRRSGRVPGVLYGRGREPFAFDVDERELRHALAASGAVLELQIDGKTESAVVKEAQKHPVRGEVMHVDLFRVDLNKPIQAAVTVHLIGAEDAPGAKEGGVLEHVTREVNVEALPNVIPESIDVDVSEMVINDTLTLSAVTAPEGVTLLDDLEETVIATLTPPRLQVEPTDALETETEVIGEGGDEAADEGEAGGDDAAGDDSGE